MRILIVEDNPEFMKTACEILRDENHKVVEARNAELALTEIKKLHTYDLIILDLMMELGGDIQPDEAVETGAAIYLRIRKVNDSIPVLVLSARGKPDIWGPFSKDNKVAYFEKPITKNTGKFLSLVAGESWYRS